MPLGKRVTPHTGVRTGCHYLISLSVCLSVCVTFVVFTEFESCTRPIFTNSISMEAGECGLTRATCFAARRFELIAVAGRLRISWCVLGGAIFFSRAFHEFAFSNSFVDPVSEQPAWTRRKGSNSQPICPSRTRANLSPPGVPFSVLPPEKFGVIS